MASDLGIETVSNSITSHLQPLVEIKCNGHILVIVVKVKINIFSAVESGPTLMEYL